VRHPLKKLSLAGFTLLELMVTLSIAGVLVAMATPTFKDVISNNRLTAYHNEFVAALNLARSEAIKRGTSVVLRRGNGSSVNQWHKGFDIFVDSNGNGIFNDDGDGNDCEANAGIATEDCLLKTYDELPANLTLMSNANFNDFIRFNAMGRSKAGSLILCDKAAKEPLDRAKVIVITVTGRVRLGNSKETDVDGTNKYSC
jgi:type IV fimbrial biogenesis protein FimT